MQSSYTVKSKAQSCMLLNFKYRHWLPIALLCLAAMPCMSSGRRPTVIPPPGAGPDIGRAISSPQAKAPKTPPPAPSPVAQPSPPPPARTSPVHPSPPSHPSHAPQSNPPAAPPAAQAPSAPKPVAITVAPIAFPMEPLPANPVPNATALKPTPAPVAAVASNNKIIPVPVAVAPTAPVAANVQNAPVDAPGLDPRITTPSNPSSALMPGQLTSKLNQLPSSLPASGLTSPSFNYQAKSQITCTHISTKAHAQQPGTTLVDLTGDGLIVSALPSAQVRNSLQMAGYTQTALNQPASWCLPAAAMSALLRAPARDVRAIVTRPQQKLVQVKGQWQLVQSTATVNSRSAVNPKSPSTLHIQGQAFKVAPRAG